MYVYLHIHAYHDTIIRYRVSQQHIITPPFILLTTNCPPFNSIFIYTLHLLPSHAKKAMEEKKKLLQNE
jgi:hypothetical protein